MGPLTQHLIGLCLIYAPCSSRRLDHQVRLRVSGLGLVFVSGCALAFERANAGLFRPPGDVWHPVLVRAECWPLRPPQNAGLSGCHVVHPPES